VVVSLEPVLKFAEGLPILKQALRRAQLNKTGLGCQADLLAAEERTFF